MGYRMSSPRPGLGHLAGRGAAAGRNSQALFLTRGGQSGGNGSFQSIGSAEGGSRSRPRKLKLRLIPVYFWQSFRFLKKKKGFQKVSFHNNSTGPSRRFQKKEMASDPKYLLSVQIPVQNCGLETGLCVQGNARPSGLVREEKRSICLLAVFLCQRRPAQLQTDRGFLPASRHSRKGTRSAAEPSRQVNKAEFCSVRGK